MTIYHDPNAVLDYNVDWSDWLATGETISTSTWTVPAGLTKTTDSATSAVATAWITSGTAGVEYLVTNRIITSAGRTDDRSIRLSVKER